MGAGAEGAEGEGERHVSAAHYKDTAVADLPSEKERAAGLDRGELVGGRIHWGIYIERSGGREGKQKKEKLESR